DSDRRWALLRPGLGGGGPWWAQGVGRRAQPGDGAGKRTLAPQMEHWQSLGSSRFPTPRTPPDQGKRSADRAVQRPERFVTTPSPLAPCRSASPRMIVRVTNALHPNTTCKDGPDPMPVSPADWQLRIPPGSPPRG